MRKRISIFLFIFVIAVFITSCGDNPQEISSYEDANKDWLASVDSAIDGQELTLQSKLEWGMTKDKLTKIVKEPYYYDSDDYLSVTISSSLPDGNQWKNDDDSINPDAFKAQDVLAFYSLANDSLSEYGYMVYGTTLEQYDFLKEFYTKKYGKPAKEEFIWNDENYEPTGEEDLYEMFLSAEVKVLTVWDIEELDTVLVMDWLTDTLDIDNDYGQISFYERSEDFDVNSVTEE